MERPAARVHPMILLPLLWLVACAGFVALKLAGVVGWPWWAVATLPVWGTLGLAAVNGALALAVAGVVRGLAILTGRRSGPAPEAYELAD